ncbi:MAG TPA: type I-U CRISPR-associated RAMP protein Csb1/Cas7u, partial [Bryobacteraceae bacterium]
MTFDKLSHAISGHAAAIRCRSALQPAAGAGTKVFPPTHSGGVYATEQRRIPGRDQPVECVLLDSVQSQANRMEDALQDAVDRGLIELPLINVDFSEANASLDRPVNERITSLTVPHRLADAILRDCEITPGQLFKDSEFAKAWGAATLTNATAVFAQCPTSLFLGMWGSPERAGIGARFARAIVSEVVGINAVYGVRTGSRIDPLDTRSQVQVINEGQGKWRIAKKGEKGAVNPSDVGHSNIPPSFSKYQKGAEGRDPLADQNSKFTLQMKVTEGGTQVDLDAGTQSVPEARQG